MKLLIFVLTTCLWLCRGILADDCANGIHIVFARGTFSPQGTDYWGYIAGALQSRIPGTTIYNVEYPAYVPFETSEPQGVRDMSEHIKKYADSCPDTPIVLAGFSQGAQVVMDTLCGTEELTFLNTPTMAKTLDHHILAALVYADLSRVPNQPYNRGSAGQKGHGIFQRANPQDCAPFAPRLRSYCNVNDPFCYGGLDVAQHGTYFGLYDGEAIDFIVDEYNKAHG